MPATPLTGAERARRHIEKLKASGTEVDFLRKEAAGLRLERDGLAFQVADIQGQLEDALSGWGKEKLEASRLRNEIDYLTGRVETLNDTVALLELKPHRPAKKQARNRVRAPR